MTDRIKSYVMYIVRIGLRLFCVFPIKENRIMFCTSSGDGFYCNPKYIYNAFVEYGDEKYEFIWAFANPNNYQNIKSKRTEICKYHSLRYYYYRMTTSVYISNVWAGAEVPKRKGQLRIQTWHGGGCYKKNVGQEKRASRFEEKRVELNGLDTDLFISSCQEFSEKVVRDSFHYKNKVLPLGMPRNDFLVRQDSIYWETRYKIRQEFNAEGKMIVLFAPTWRYDTSKCPNTIDCKLLSKAIEKRYGKEAIFLFRAHIHMRDIYEGNMINVSQFPDMQELLAATDILITDYSSCIWDFSFTYRPCILYVPDLEVYEYDRGFYTSIYRWGFPVCQTSEEIAETIRSMDEDDIKRAMIRHHEDFGSFEKGTAADRLIAYLQSLSDNNRSQ